MRRLKNVAIQNITSTSLGTLILFAFFLYLNAKIRATEINPFSNKLNHYSGIKIEEFALMGLRCSGTNFLYHLICENFPDYKFNHPTSLEKVPQKHHWPYIDETKHAFYNYDNCLFILIVRDPYTWLQSFFANKARVSYQNRKSFKHFIQSKWQYTHPKTRVKDRIIFENILDSRNFEIANFLDIGNRVANFLVVSYEKVDQDPKGFIEFLSHFFKLKKAENFINIRSYKGTSGTYKKKKYQPIGIQELKFINQYIDWSQEKIFGYKPMNASPNT